MRGSIEQRAKRGEVLVQLVRHSDRAVLAQQRYDGSKESVKPRLQKLIAQAGGVFLIGLKNNQKELLADLRRHAACLKPVNIRNHWSVEISNHVCDFSLQEDHFNKKKDYNRYHDRIMNDGY